ncbi:hypothetical protein LTR62_008859 [Meristemomyces frigidus]|uniref:SET domain-containing protein n=1 Tax=Meristemomyces frigidus TaxID=1508187 RepID=A0AAN7YCG2_9PEZI|nr:hypothetical protein LTR62_008859 [Meristemomyces frigidus]
MTESFFPDATTISHVPTHHALPNGIGFTRNHHFGAPLTNGTLDSTPEDDGQISCFCGFQDDDGNTVACDSCNRWQHTICYYPEYEGHDLPPELQHFCIDCRPRNVDAHSARLKQRGKREQQDAYGGIKRQASKSHKKKVKDPAGSPYTNGWPLDKTRHDRNSASPRDLPPPAKRPKTSHRPSDNTTGSVKGHSRKRTATNSHRRSTSRSPESPISLYSEEFIRCYHEDEWTYCATNVMDDLRVTNALSQWLKASDDDFFDEIGIWRPEILSRWDRHIDDIPGKVRIDVHENHDPAVKDEDGHHPTWKTATVQEPLAAGAFIGELRGRIGFKEEYKQDSANRWSTLRHPEPFVFFHSRLPIYIDARNEGTELRYVRRSCTPNARLTILVTNGTDYHFCFMAIAQIEPGDEISIAWDTAESILQRSGSAENPSPLSQQDMAQLAKWVSTVLANCGPCACQQPQGSCNMARFDRRCSSIEHDGGEARSAKTGKTKKKKTSHSVTPLDTHAVNSRAGSETHKAELEDDPTDSRSASGSASNTRDNTPNTHYSANGSVSTTMPEMSERERRKVAKEEEIFRKQAEEQSGRQNKKKRHSAGSNVTTPATASTKQAVPTTAPKYADAGTTSRPPDLPTARSMNSKRAAKSVTQKAPMKPEVKSAPRPKVTYVDSAIQCDMDAEDARRRETEFTAAPKKRYVSLTQRLLQRCAANNVRHGRAVSQASATSKSNDGASGNDEEHKNATSVEEQHHHAPTAHYATDDVHMQDLPDADATQLSPHPLLPAQMELQIKSEMVSQAPHMLSEPSAPPWAKDASTEHSNQMYHNAIHKPQDVHLQMPPPPVHPSNGATSPQQRSSPPNAHSNGLGIADSLSHSPASLLSTANTFLPAPTAASMPTPSPMRKKMSLSEYRQRKNNKDPGQPRDGEGEPKRDSSPASVASGPTSIAPMLARSDETTGGANHSQAIEDDVVMGEAAVSTSALRSPVIGA